MEYYDTVEGRAGSQDMPPITAHLFQREILWDTVDLAEGSAVRHKAVCVVTDCALRYVTEHGAEELDRQPIYANFRILEDPYACNGASEQIGQLR